MTIGVPTVARAGTRYVAETGADAGNCGLDLASACRSITQAIALAAPGDVVLVEPGRYGDLNKSGTLGDMPGEETGSPGCGCVLSINKPVLVRSTGGAAVTTIDGSTVDTNTTVLVITEGGEFGRPGKGFSVTETARENEYGGSGGAGVILDAVNFTVRGNHVLNSRAKQGIATATGIVTVNYAPITIEGNLVVNWGTGIIGRGAAVIRKNATISNYRGIEVDGATAVGNIITSNASGALLRGSATVTGNAVQNNIYGFDISSSFSGAVNKNNLLGNACGVSNTLAGVNMTNNYWGSPDGPGAPGADRVCEPQAGRTITAPFASTRFVVKPPKL